MSAFKHTDSELSKPKTICDEFNQFMDEAFNAAIPSDAIKDMAPIWKYTLGWLSLIIGFIMFVVFLSVGIDSARHAQYLAPVSEKTDYCDDVLAETSGTYYATNNGVFSRFSNFSYTDAIYQFTLSGYTASPDTWATAVNAIAASTRTYGSFAKNNSLGQNLPFYTNYATKGDSSSTYFSLTGDIKVALNKPNVIGKIGSISGICDTPVITMYDKSTGILEMLFDVTAYETNILCTNALNVTVLAELGYDSQFTGNIFQLQLDVQTLLTAYVLNTGLMSVSDYTFVSETNGVKSYIDPRYPGMAFVYCVNYNDQLMCGIPIGNTIGFPMFNDMGAYPNLGEPIQCDCTDTSNKELYGPGGICNYMNFFIGIMIWPDYVNNPVAPFNNFKSAYGPNYIPGMKAMFNAVYATSVWGPVKNYSTNSSFLEKAFDPCMYEGSSCTIINFSLFNPYPARGYSVSDYYYQLLDGACKDSFSISEAAANNMINYPYAELTESYVTCVDSYGTIFMNNVGISTGNTTTYLPFIVLVLIGFAYGYQKFTGKRINPTFTKAEKEEALESLALCLLLQRDQKFEFNNQGSTKHTFPMLKQLVEELTISSAYNPDRKLLGISDLVKQKILRKYSDYDDEQNVTISPFSTEMSNVNRITTNGTRSANRISENSL